MMLIHLDSRNNSEVINPLPIGPINIDKNAYLTIGKYLCNKQSDNEEYWFQAISAKVTSNLSLQKITGDDLV
ncbi:unnamed protein product [Heterobilharzia americana]|nr:unnamed protein product [Heterobilharzia americana]